MHTYIHTYIHTSHKHSHNIHTFIHHTNIHTTSTSSSKNIPTHTINDGDHRNRYYFMCKVRINDDTVGDMEIEWQKNGGDIDGSFEM